MDERKLQEALDFLLAVSEAEVEVATFYEACQLAWPAEEIWGALRVQELQHAGLALRLKALVAGEPDAFQPLRPLSRQSVETFIASLRASALKVRSRAYNLRQALGVAKDLEHSILEARYDQLLSTRNADYGRIIEELQKDTLGHREQLQRRLLALEPGE